MVPRLPLPPATPFTCHTNAVPPSLAVAVICWVALASTCMPEGETLTPVEAVEPPEPPQAASARVAAIREKNPVCEDMCMRLPAVAAILHPGAHDTVYCNLTSTVWAAFRPKIPSSR